MSYIINYQELHGLRLEELLNICGWILRWVMKMASGSFEKGCSLKVLEGDLIDAGNRLLSTASLSTNELLVLLERAESLLAKVRQQPSKSIRKALLPAMKALITDDLLHNRDINVKSAVASCFNELTRISAPEYTYPDDLMKEFFRLYMISFKQLSYESNHNYSRARRILETMAKVKSSLMMIDTGSDALVIEMFQLFLSIVSSNDQSDIFMYIEAIMSSVIYESDVSIELLIPVLDSVKMSNKAKSPLSWELGRKVLENCSSKIQRCLQIAVKAKSLDLGDYAAIVASICNYPSNRDSVLDRDSVDNSFETSNASQQIVQSNMSAGAGCWRKNKRPNSRKRAEEEDTISTKAGEDVPFPSEVGDANDSSQKGCEGFDEANLQKMKRILLNPQHSKSLKNEKKLVGSRIKVWWPMDEMFYPGKVKAFDPHTRKHLVMYDDNEVEMLDLRKETWKPLQKPPQMQVADQPLRNSSHVKSVEKKGKSKKKLSMAASSKRPKTGSKPIMTSKEKNNAPDTNHDTPTTNAKVVW